MEYDKFILQKIKHSPKTGFKIKDDWLNPNLFDYQREIVSRACEHGKYALFMDTGLGKSITQMNYADAVNRHTNKPVLMLAPLAVVYQMLKEAGKFGFELNHARDNNSIKNGLNITNYESLHKLDSSLFACVVLDESSILKGFDSKTRRYLTDEFRHTKYKLACTATPSPNDFVELGTHSEFLGNYTVAEMKMIYFTQDRMNTQNYILKGHSEDKFWEWIASWAECLTSPSDLGYDGSAHILPSLNEIYHEISHDDCSYETNGLLFEFAESNATTIGRNKRKTIDQRAEKVASLQTDEPHLVWCDTNDEADHLKQAMPWAVEVRGSDKEEKKAEMAMAFANGEIRTLISKASIFGYGMNFQNIHNMTFTGLNYSYESYYQAVRRMYRFGQKNEVNVNVIVADNERSILDSIHRKKGQHEKMKSAMQKAIISAKRNSELKVDVFNKFKFPSFIKSKETL